MSGTRAESERHFSGAGSERFNRREKDSKTEAKSRTPRRALVVGAWSFGLWVGIRLPRLEAGRTWACEPLPGCRIPWAPACPSQTGSRLRAAIGNATSAGHRETGGWLATPPAPDSSRRSRSAPPSADQPRDCGRNFIETSPDIRQPPQATRCRNAGISPWAHGLCFGGRSTASAPDGDNHRKV